MKYFLGYRTRSLTLNPNPITDPNPKPRAGSGVVLTGVCGQGMSKVFAAPPIKYFKIFYRLSIPNRNPNPKP